MGQESALDVEFRDETSENKRSTDTAHVNRRSTRIGTQH